ncbi:EMB2654 [Symbiodinium sp. KB8]|nr:EMB2654 [Symbiodinium sp. KB8]
MHKATQGQSFGELRRQLQAGKLGLRQCNAAISSLGQKQQWQAALQLLQDLEFASIQRSGVSFSSGISACGRAKQWQRALALLDDMLQLLLPPGVIAFCSAITTCASSGAWRKGMELVALMRGSADDFGHRVLQHALKT